VPTPAAFSPAIPNALAFASLPLPTSSAATIATRFSNNLKPALINDFPLLKGRKIKSSTLIIDG